MQDVRELADENLSIQLKQMNEGLKRILDLHTLEELRILWNNIQVRSTQKMISVTFPDKKGLCGVLLQEERKSLYQQIYENILPQTPHERQDVAFKSVLSSVWDGYVYNFGVQTR